MDATTLLKKDHDAVLQLFRAFAEAGSDAEARRGLYRNIRQELQTHSRVEENVFYPAVMRLRAEPARDTIRYALEDHHVFYSLLAELVHLDPEDSRYSDMMCTMPEIVERAIHSDEDAIVAPSSIRQ